MKSNILKFSAILVFLNLLNSSFASTVTFINDSTEQENINVVYKLVPKNSEKILMTSSPMTVAIGTAVNVNLMGYKSVAVVPISVNGHSIPSEDPSSPEACAAIIDNDRTFTKLTFTYVKKQPIARHILFVQKIRNKIYILQ